MAAKRAYRLLSDSVGAINAVNEVWSSSRLGGSSARVKDPTGAYRMFLRFGKIGDRRIAAVAYGRKKSKQSLPRWVIDLAQRKVDAFLAELGANGFIDQEQ